MTIIFFLEAIRNYFPKFLSYTCLSSMVKLVLVFQREMVMADFVKIVNTVNRLHAISRRRPVEFDKSGLELIKMEAFVKLGTFR